MRNILIFLMPLLFVGCATQLPVAVRTAPSAAIAAASPTKIVETRYDVRGYNEAANPAIRHEAHAVYRRTRVPVTASDQLEIEPRVSYAPASVVPLPASDELAAELATQKKITGDIRAMQVSIVEIEQSMRAQYALLVRQTADALNLRDQLAAERSRIPSVSPVETGSAAPVIAPSNSADVKW